MNRRQFIAFSAALLIASPVFAADDAIISPEEAHRRAAAGDIVLVDIRTEGEWQETGVGDGAHAISMRDRDFLSKLDTLIEGDRSRKVAVICAQGVRSAWLRIRMEQAGFSDVLDVSRGMLGNERGTGWIEQGLPVKNWTN